jgi:hypothetical protein
MSVDPSTRLMLKVQARMGDRFNYNIDRPSSGKRSILGEIIYTIQNSKEEYDRFKYGKDMPFWEINYKLRELQRLIEQNETPDDIINKKADEIIELRRIATKGEGERLSKLAELNNIYKEQIRLYKAYKAKKARSYAPKFLQAEEIPIPSDIKYILENEWRTDARIEPDNLNDMSNWNETIKQLIKRLKGEPNAPAQSARGGANKSKVKKLVKKPLKKLVKKPVKKPLVKPTRKKVAPKRVSK